MPGVRLHHPTLRAAEGATLTYVVELPLDYATGNKPGARDRGNEPCPTCSDPWGMTKKVVTHRRKALHLWIDAKGDVIVAPAIFEQLKTVPTMAGLVLVEEVKTPPPLRIGAVNRDKARIVTATSEHIAPSKHKYDAEKTMWAPLVPAMDEIRERLDRKETAKKAEKRTIFITTKG